eukprot:g6525.t1 g6525   contig23:673206-674531(+)
MPMPKVQVQNLPTACAWNNQRVRSHSSSDDSSTPSSPTSELSSEQSWENTQLTTKSTNTARRRRSRGNKGGQNRAMANYVSPPHDRPMTKNDLYFALDCEMVGVGPEGLDSAVARVTIINYAEDVILDTYVKVSSPVTDYRTFVSGIQPSDLEGPNAMPLDQVQTLVKTTLHGKILIGHALENDLKALGMEHPWHDVRDSASYPPFMKEVRENDYSDGVPSTTSFDSPGNNSNGSGATSSTQSSTATASTTNRALLRPRKLKELTHSILGEDIQQQGQAHDPVEDARAALRLYKSSRLEWEQLVVAQVACARVQEGRECEPSSSRESAVGTGGYDHSNIGVGYGQSNYRGRQSRNSFNHNRRHSYGYHRQRSYDQHSSSYQGYHAQNQHHGNYAQYQYASRRSVSYSS